ncbi:methyltransferase domain-containing protein [Piscinibacter sp. XHJ-5]|uniref:class I SAM-dependent methyltransferase n=1 Tax=Piscinibacter sp. XHJ-5 TaxID=3037797 RepID=UPI0024531069|nr:methyltransferase domain-containing protein [Piscinibacter sp. XHJ-5]
MSGREHAAALKERRPSAAILEKYRSEFGYDAARCFEGVPEVGIYECEDTGFRFFYPLSVVGDESLYRRLEQFPWNYKDDKWEHDASLSYLRPGQRVLDVGCGRGSFLHKAQTQRGAIVTGIELNRSAAAFARERGVKVAEELLDAHAAAHALHYDVVTSFQVLEHVPDPHAFISDCLRVLKPGGMLIYGVPNNDGFLRYADAPLNGPPHHMGLWTRRSLAALCSLFPIDVRAFEIEPLAEIDWYQAVSEARYLPRDWRRWLYYRLGGAKLVRRFLVDNASTIAGHTILVVFEKRA